MSGYVLGETAGEHERLERQAAAMAAMTRGLFLRAGLAPGMRVLDVGCGPGDVSLVAAGIVGPGGSVLGIDRDATALERARARAAADGVGHASFACLDMAEELPEGPFDAVVGRLILMYAPDPAATLRRFADLAPGGILAFQETDITYARSEPPIPCVSESIARVLATFRAGGANPSMGLALDGAFREAGLRPETSGGMAMDGYGDGFCPAWLASTVRSLLPMMERAGVATAAEVDVETLEERIRSASRETKAFHVGPLMVGSWARVPA